MDDAIRGVPVGVRESAERTMPTQSQSAASVNEARSTDGASSQSASRPSAWPPDLVSAARGLLQRPKVLPHWLLYDERGSELFEQITALPEYDLTRNELEIFESMSGAIAQLAVGPGRKLTVFELGAGTATKTEILLRACAAARIETTFRPIDVSMAALRIGADRMRISLPSVKVRPILGHHEDAIHAMTSEPGPRLVVFIGGSIGNHPLEGAAKLLRTIRVSLETGDSLLIGADIRRDPAVHLAAYDDTAGVTAAFNSNLLIRLNREAGASFDPTKFRHLAIWNAAASRVEMHLESLLDQTVYVDALRTNLHFRGGERIHTESSYKLAPSEITELLATAGFTNTSSFFDRSRAFGLHMAYVP